jgi:hypothetical protein
LDPLTASSGAGWDPRLAWIKALSKKSALIIATVMRAFNVSGRASLAETKTVAPVFYFADFDRREWSGNNCLKNKKAAGANRRPVEEPD